MSLFSKQHYEAVAKIIATMDEAGIVAAGTFANAFAADNPKFIRKRFLAACGFVEKTYNFLGEEQKEG